MCCSALSCGATNSGGPVASAREHRAPLMAPASAGFLPRSLLQRYHAPSPLRSLRPGAPPPSTLLAVVHGHACASSARPRVPPSPEKRTRPDLLCAPSLLLLLTRDQSYALTAAPWPPPSAAVAPLGLRASRPSSSLASAPLAEAHAKASAQPLLRLDRALLSLLFSRAVIRIPSLLAGDLQFQQPHAPSPSLLPRVRARARPWTPEAAALVSGTIRRRHHRVVTPSPTSSPTGLIKPRRPRLCNGGCWCQNRRISGRVSRSVRLGGW